MKESINAKGWQKWSPSKKQDTIDYYKHEIWRMSTGLIPKQEKLLQLYKAGVKELGGKLDE